MALRGAFHLKSPQDLDQGLSRPGAVAEPGLEVEMRSAL
jgi:hypothetical protein